MPRRSGTLGGLPVTVTTNGVAPNSGPATKTFVNANIKIGPPTADNPVGTTHVLTITVNGLGGNVASGTATAAIVSGPGSFVGSPTRAPTPVAQRRATCTVTITSATAGTTVVKATSSISVAGLAITRETNTAANTTAGGSGNAAKTWKEICIPAEGSISGNDSTSGTAGNVKTFTLDNGVKVKVTGWSRNKSTGAWAPAYVGAYGGGLGVTDSVSDGNGSNDQHTLDNGGADNYLLYEFDQPVIADQLYLGYVAGDSDLSLWLGTVAGAYTSAQTLSDAYLGGLTAETNDGAGSARWANFNPSEINGNVMIVAARTGGDSNDKVKVEKLKTVCPGGPSPSISIVKKTNGTDNNVAPGPTVEEGSTVTWTYEVTNTGNVTLTNVRVDDDKVGVICTGLTLAPGASQTCTKTGTAVIGQYTNLGTVTGTPPGEGVPKVTATDPDNYKGAPSGRPSIDIEKYTLIQAPTGAALCVNEEKPTQLTFLYTGDDPPVPAGTFGNGNTQGKFAFSVNNQTGSQTVNIVVGSGLVATPAQVAVGESFTVKTTSGGTMGSSTQIVLKALNGTVLEDMSVHTSCSSPLVLGDQFLSLNLTGGVDANGTTSLPAPGLGEDADAAPGPEATVGAGVTWNYVVTNTGDTVLTNIRVTDDHAPNVVPAFVKELSGDGDASFEPGEKWLYSATGTATLGQYANLGTAKGTPPSGPDVMDTDPSHYKGKYPDVELCTAYDKPTAMVMKYLGNLDNNNTQASGKVELIAGGNPNGATNVRIVVTENSTPGTATSSSTARR